MANWNNKLLLTSACAFFMSMIMGQAHALSISTGFAGGNGQDGNMFDVVTLGSALTVTAFDINLDTGGAQTVKIYSKSGTWVGSENNGAAWTLIDTITGVTSSGANVPTFIDVADFILPAVSTTALYLTTPDNPNFSYTNGTGVGNIAAANSDLRILEGSGNEYEFGFTYTPRIWNGTIYYSSSQVPEPATLALMGLGLAGIGFARKKKQA